ncbi:MAG: response regulator, partial [Steroidobacter sp.]
RIFDEYYQVDTHGAKRMGVGLGLAIVKEVARLLGMTIRIASVVGEGTQARLYIPERLLVARPIVPTADTSVSSTCVTDKARLFLVEDNDGVRLATETFLKLEGYAIESASSVAEAESKFAKVQRRDIVIADYHLDVHNTGLDLLLKLRKRLGYDLPGIILSGDLPSVLRTLKAPVENSKFLSKPVDTAELLSAISELSAWSRSSDENRGVPGVSRVS